MKTRTILARVLHHPLVWIFLLALGVRLYQLTYHSLWYDEVVSTFWAARPVTEIWRVGMSLAQDKHPPLYYLALRGWIALFGGGDLAVRSLGVMIGALAVMPAYGIGRLAGGRLAGALGALLLALNPFLVWYSQETRMFMPATTCALVGLYGLLRLVLPVDVGSPNSRRADGAGSARQAWLHALLAVGGLVGAFYSYLYSAFVMPVAAAWLLLAAWLNRRQSWVWRRSLIGAAALSVAALLFLPLALSAWRTSGAESEPGRPFVGLWPALADLFQAYVLGRTAWSQGVVGVVLGAAALLAVIGLGVPRAAPLRRGGAFLAAWLIVIVSVGGVLLVRDARIFSETRYQIVLVPALCLAWGRGLAWLSHKDRRAGLAAACLVCGVTLAALPYDWAPQNRREAWREAAAYVETRAGPRDAVLVQADYVHVALERYLTRPANIFYPFTDRLNDASSVDGPLEGLAGFETVWVVQSHHGELDPQNLVLGWFNARYPQITEVYPTGIIINGFDQRYRRPLSEAQVPPNGTTFSLGPLRLLSCHFTPARLPAHDDTLHPPSGWVHVTSEWTLDAQAPAPAGDLRPVIRLVDAAGQVWGESLARSGSVFNMWPSSRWVAGEAVRAGQDVNINPVTPPGSYRLIVNVPGVQDQPVCGNVEIIG